MSVSSTVYLNRSKMLRPADWAAAIRAAGFPLELDQDFDVKTFSGFLPCKYEKKDAGFEYFYSEVSEMELEEEVASSIGDRDIAISFVTHSQFRDLACAVAASAVLCEKSAGVLDDQEAGELISAGDVVARARGILASIAGDLE